MRTVVRLAARILQVHELAPGATIGYGAIFKVQRPSRIATIACGYADGFLRALSVATGEAGPVGYIGDYPVPIVGRVSMDFITVDVTDVPEELTRRGGWVEVMGERVTVDDLTDKAGTIGYELLSRLGPACIASTRGPEPAWRGRPEPRSCARTAAPSLRAGPASAQRAENGTRSPRRPTPPRRQARASPGPRRAAPVESRDAGRRYEPRSSSACRPGSPSSTASPAAASFRARHC